MSVGPLLSVQKVSKSFAGVQVLYDVSLDLNPGEVVGLLGENGAGKSTLLNIISGNLSLDSGGLSWEGEAVHFSNAAVALRLGISQIYQELSAIGGLSVMENLFLGDYGANRFGIVGRRKMASDARRLLARVGADHIAPEATLARLGIADQQMVEIAKAVSRNSRLVLMDEPTSSLTIHEVDRLLRMVREMRESGVSVVFISHRLEEVLNVADRAVVLRDGRVVSDRPIQQVRRDTLLADMAGREFYFGDHKPIMPAPDSSVLMSVRDLEDESGRGPFTFDLKAGEVLGVFGLVSSGRTELLQMLCGCRSRTKGTIEVADRETGPKSPAEAWRRGIAYLPEDRKQNGIFPQLTVRENLVLSCRNATGAQLTGTRMENATAAKMYEQLGIRAAGLDQEIRYLSGGNQQKTILARCLAVKPRILLLDEPTHGIDIRTKAELYNTIETLAGEGMGIVFVSSEIPEILAVASTVLVISQGRQVLTLPNQGLDDKTLLEAAFYRA
jgi:ribose transport system ATP-binding protein